MPTSHVLHAAAAVNSVILPVGHPTHVKPSVPLYLPGTHAVHDISALPPKPALHVHELAKSFEVDNDGQLLQSSVEDLYFPATHAVHL